jgi:hydrogenase maturation protease
VLVIGVGNELRGDDAAGLEVVRRMTAQDLPPGARVQELRGEALDLLELWCGAEAVILVDTVRSGAAAGTIHRFDASSEPLPARFRAASGHTVSVPDAIELARGLDKLPPRVIVFGIEGGRFTTGTSLQECVRAAVGTVRQAVAREALALS